ncbi:MAG: hypothetical protein M3O22_07775 [Pseudomonadota bacterium]|nr:hypothetical protein [Pseudomonadota bacterium]
MKPGKFALITLCLALVLFLLPVGIVMVFDPFFVLHRPWFMKVPLLDGTDRYQNAGLINSFLADPAQGFDTVIIGTSMSQNFPVDSRTLKLTLAGGTARELGVIADRALSTGNVRSVIWEIFTSYSSTDPQALHGESPLPLFLYNDNVPDDWRYVFSNDVIEEALKLAAGKVRKRRSLETLYTWTHEDRFTGFASPATQKELRRSAEKADLPLQVSLPRTMKNMDFPNISRNLVPVLKAHPDVRFSLFFPPVSRIAHILAGNEGFWKEMMMRRAVLETVRDMDNVAVYGFDLEQNLAEVVTFYCDPSHYSPEISARMAEAVKKGKNRITLADWEVYTRILVKKVNRYAGIFLAQER